MPLPPPRKPAAVPANNGKVTPGPGRQRGGGFMLPPPPADSDAYSTDSDSSDDVEEDEDADEHRQVQPQKQEQDKSTNSGLDPSRRTGQFPAEGSTKRTEDGERIGAEHSNSALDPSQKRKNPNSKSAVDVAAVAQRAAAAAAAAKKFQQQQQLLIQQQRRRAVQNQPSAKGPAAAAPPGPVLNSSKAKGASNSAAGARSATGSAKRASEEDEDDYDLGLGPGPGMSASQSLDMDIDGEELWTHSYCVVCDRLISEPSSQPDTPGAAAAAGANVAKEAGSLAMGPSQHFNGHSNKLKEKSAPTPADVAVDPLPRRGSKTALPTSTGAPVRRNNSSSRLSSQQPPANTSAPVRRNNSSSRLSSHGVRAGASAGSGLLGHPPRRTGSTGSRLNALSNLKPTTKLHEDKASKNAAPSTSSESGTGSKGEKPLSRADSSASIASRAGSSSAAGSSPPPSVSSQGHSSTSSLRSRVKARAGGASKGNAAGAGAHTPEGNASRRSSTAAMVPSLSSSSIHGDKEKEKTKEVVSHRPKKFGLYCSERCRLIDQQRSAGLGQLRPYLSYPLSPLGGPYPSIAPAAIAVTTVGSDQPAAVIPVSSSTLSLSIAAASRSNKLPVLAATAVVAANANGSTPMPALVELAKSSAEGSATLNQGLSMSMSMGMGFPSAIGAYAPAPSAAPLRGQPVLTSQTATPLAPMDQSSAYMSSYGYPGSIPAVTGAFQLPTRTRTDWTPGSECPDCSDCCTCPHCLLADEEAEARTTSAASGTAPSGSGASDTATSESSHAALYGFGSGNGANGLDSLGGMSGSAAAAGKGKQRTASGRLLTPHLFPLNEGETDYFSAYPEQIRRVLLDEHKKAQALTRTTNLLPHLHRSTSPEAASMGRQRSQSDRSSDSENGLSTAMGSLEFGPPGAPVFEPGHPLMGRRANGTGTATSSSGTISRPRSVFSGSSSQPRGMGQHAAATSSASTSFSAAPTVQAASGSTSQFSDGPNSSSITAVPGDAARSSSRTRSTSVPGGRAVEAAAAAAGADGPSSDARSGLRGTGVLGTSLGTALHRASSTSHARNGSDSVRTSTNSSRRSTIVSASYASPLRFLQPGLKHVGTPSVAAVDFEAMRGASTAEQERSQEEEENEEFARLRRGDRRAEWSTGSSSVRTSPSKNSQAVSIPASSWRGHRRAGSAMSARAAFDSSLDAQFAQSMGGGRPASVAGTSGLSFGALNSLKRAQALAMVRELDRERVTAGSSGAVDASLNLEGGTSVSVATSLNAVREGRQEHHRREGDELTVGLVQQQQFNRDRAAEVDGGEAVAESAKRRYSTGATSRSGGGGFFNSLWSSIRGGSSSTSKDGMPRTETAPAASSSSLDPTRKALPSSLPPPGPIAAEVVREEEEHDEVLRAQSASAAESEDRALISSTNLDRGETIKPSRSGRGVAGQGSNSSRRFDSMRSEASGRDAASVRSGSTGAGSEGSANNHAAGAGYGGRALGSMSGHRLGADPSNGNVERIKTIKPKIRRGSVPFYTEEVGQGQIPGDAGDHVLEDAEGRPRSYSNSSHRGVVSQMHRHSISNGAASGVESVERRKLAKMEQQRAHRQQRSRDVSILPPLLAPNARSNSASSSNLRMLHGSSMTMVHPGSTRASSHGRIAPATLPLSNFGGPAAAAAMIPPTLRSPRSFQGAALVDPLVAGFSPTRASTSQTFYGSSPRGRLGWGSSMTPLSAAGSATSSAAITPVASAANLAMMGQAHSYSGSYRSATTPAFAAPGGTGPAQTQAQAQAQAQTQAHGHHHHQHHHHHHHHHHGQPHHHHGHAHRPGTHGHGHSHSHSHAQATTHPVVPPPTGHLGMLGTLPPSHTAHFSRHATMPSFRSTTPSVPEHGGEMSSEALSGAMSGSPTIKMFARGGGGFAQPVGGPSRPRSGMGRRAESPAQQTALPVGAIENITLLTQEQYQEHLQQQSQQQVQAHQQQQPQRYDRSRRTWSHEALSSMAGSGKTYPIMALPGSGEVHDVYDSEWTSIIGSGRQDEETSNHGGGHTPSAANPGAYTTAPSRMQQRKALFHFGESSRDSQGH